MLTHTLIRPARVEDSEAIAALMREGVTDQVRRITIMGSPHLAKFIADELAMGDSEEYVVGTIHKRVVGMCSWKHIKKFLHLNHIYLAGDIRGQGLGTTLMLDGLSRIRQASEHMLSVDVFFDNPRAQAWYRSLAMRSEKHVRWIRLPLPLVQSSAWSGCTLSGFAEARVKQRRYGFSQFVLSTSAGTYHVSRLGDQDFRVGTVAILQDSVALGGLAHVDSKRQLLCIASAEDYAGLSLGAHACVAESERLVASCAIVREHLESSLSRWHMSRSLPVRV